MKKINESPWDEAIKIIISKTRNNKLKWSEYSSKNVDIENVEGPVFCAKLIDRYLILYKRIFKKLESIPISSTDIYSNIGGVIDETEYDLAFFDKQKNRILYQFPNNYLIDDLYEAVSFKIFDVEDYLKNLINLDSDKQDDFDF